MGYALVTFEYWYACNPPHSFIQIVMQGFDTKKDARKYLEKLKEKMPNATWLNHVEIMHEKEVRKHIKEDDKYIEELPDGCWKFPPRYIDIDDELDKEIVDEIIKDEIDEIVGEIEDDE